MAQKRKLKLNLFFEYPLRLILWPIIIGKAIALMPDIFTLDIFYFWDQRYSFWAALITFVLLIFLLLHKKKESFLPWADALSIPFLIELIFGNIGKYLDGAGYGQPTALPWGVTFENISVSYTVPIHPTQIYQLIYVLLILFSSIYISKKYQYLNRDGDLFFYCTFAYSACRFIEEFFRGDNVLMIGSLRLNQVIALLIAIFIAIFFFTKNKNKLSIW
ncbi:hypothetical protein A2272_04145 [Candidatus Peregrinibacteria bacterium RIFOXYA12_FULL_33_12]|nr:MAG: hypothetical protein A2272_04145 [Candidatus Peregrinibacteria bacterium RIFOXYA12_FULL_33_12]OGJ44909.1 MAG: hypothetical protein A2263_03210 [Candidatus Peregrinibacteria bacterium RIFOXYA2_FULL_33_21]